MPFARTDASAIIFTIDIYGFPAKKVSELKYRFRRFLERAKFLQMRLIHSRDDPDRRSHEFTQAFYVPRVVFSEFKNEDLLVTGKRSRKCRDAKRSVVASRWCCNILSLAQY